MGCSWVCPAGVHQPCKHRLPALLPCLCNMKQRQLLKSGSGSKNCPEEVWQQVQGEALLLLLCLFLLLLLLLLILVLLLLILLLLLLLLLLLM